MSTVFRTTGIPLSSRPFREADAWFSILTKEHGKIACLARGAYKPLAKLSPHLALACEMDLLLVHGRTYHTVAGVERLRTYPTLYQDHTRLLLALNSLHLVDLGTREMEYDPVVYGETRAWLRFLERAPSLSQERAAFLLAVFALKLLAIVGYRPELSHCLQCKKRMEPSAIHWHAVKGGVVCEQCYTEDQEQWFAARSMDRQTLKMLRFAMGETFEHMLRLRLEPERIMPFHEAVESLLVSHFPTVPANSLRGACLL